VIVVDNNQLRVVEQYKYLGSLIKTTPALTQKYPHDARKLSDHSTNYTRESGRRNT